MGADTRPAPPGLRSLRADDDGLFFDPVDPHDDAVVDVLFDGRRIWSFWTVRDSEGAGSSRHVPWPLPLTRFLDGRTTVSLVDHVSGEQLATAEAVLGSGAGRIAVVDKQGRPLGLDKSLTLSRLFDSRDPEQLAPLLSAIDTVLEALSACGMEAFLAYGTLLGAVREGGLIGHDSDADLGYVSHYDHPADVVAESFRLQRHLVERGLSVTRYSGLAFRVNLVEADGVTRGLDVFGGFLRDGRLYLMGEVGTPFRAEWVWPLSTVTLEGRTYPAPAEPEHLLAATYGPGWRTPDPAFKFETPRETVRRLDGWFRGTRGGRSLLWGLPPPRRLRVRPVRASATLRWVREEEPEIGTFVDLGCGAGTDACWMARRGTPAVGVDFKPSHHRVMEARAGREDLPLTFLWANFNELRSTLVAGAALARTPGPRVAMARHVADGLDRTGREQLWRLAEMVVRDSGRLYLQVLRADPASRHAGAPTSEGAEDQREDRRRAGSAPLDVDALVAEIEERRGRVLARSDVVESAADGPHGTDPAEQSREVSRLVVTWQR
jgi:hypothetical protein